MNRYVRSESRSRGTGKQQRSRRPIFIATLWAAAMVLVVKVCRGCRCNHRRYWRGLLWIRGQETVVGCLCGLVVYAVTAGRSSASSLRQELLRTISGIQAVLHAIASAGMTTPAAKSARRELQHRLLALVAAFQAEMGGMPSNQNAAARLLPAVAAMQRLGYRVLATCWSLEEAGSEGMPASGLHFPLNITGIESTLTEIANAMRVGGDPVNLTHLPDLFRAEIMVLNSSLVRKEEKQPKSN